MPERLTDFPHEEIAQGYLAVGPDGAQVRLRKKGDHHSLTFKRGTTPAREEREIELSAEQFGTLWPGTEGHRLIKVRYEMPWEAHLIEIDLYRGRHEGLAVAEVEFENEAMCTAFAPPDWFGEDVTGSARYSNIALAVD